MVVATRDPVVLAALSRLEREHVCLLTADGAGEAGPPPAAVVVDLDNPGALDDVRHRRANSSAVLIAGHLAMPDRARWGEAERAGCDVVATRGAVALQVRRRLVAGRLGERRLALAASRDLAGRLGLVVRVDDSPVGPVALFNLGWTFACVPDSCPHAQAPLSDGTVEDGILTCARHGSQFDLRTGERVRGPSDLGIALLQLVEEEGRVFLVIPDPGTAS